MLLWCPWSFDKFSEDFFGDFFWQIFWRSFLLIWAFLLALLKALQLLNFGKVLRFLSSRPLAGRAELLRTEISQAQMGWLMKLRKTCYFGVLEVLTNFLTNVLTNFFWQFFLQIFLALRFSLTFQSLPFVDLFNSQAVLNPDADYTWKSNLDYYTSALHTPARTLFKSGLKSWVLKLPFFT